MSTTFAQWIKAQENRDDQVGYFARYWSQMSPGKISTPGGVERKLTEWQGELAAGKPDGQSDAAWERGKVAIEAALVGYRLAVTEYHARDDDSQPAAPHPVERGLEGSGADLHITGAPDAAGQPRTEPDSPAPAARARKSRAKAAKTAEDDLLRLDRIEDALATITAQLALLTGMLLGTLEDDEAPIDWDELWLAAQAEETG
jgi:hypothetical protein